MPAESNINTPVASPSFRGLQSYTEAQANSFFGRDAEIESLTTLINVNTLTIVFGKSGTGKTSLLNAGVFPRLRKNYCLPFKIRLEFNDDSPDLVSQIKKVLKEEIDKYGFKVKSYPTSETLWEYFHKEPLWEMVTPILVFDQFEEIFTLAKTKPRFAAKELPVFWEELSDIIENTIPEKLVSGFLEQKEKIDYNYKKQKTKVVFGFREEYLPEFENIAAKIPSIKYSRFRLMQMNGYQAYEVITKTWKENISPSAAKQIVSYLTNETDQESYDLVTVEPSLLSQVCAYIDKERIGTGSNKVSTEFLNKYPKETILRSIYNEAVTAADNALHLDEDSKEKIKRNHVKEFLEERLITAEGFRARYNLAEKDEYLRPGIGVLQNKYFIREDNNIVELTHDVLAPVIKRDREKRRRAVALVAERKKARKKVLIILLLTLLLAGGFWLVAGIKSRQAINQLSDARDSLVVINRLIELQDSIMKSKGGDPTGGQKIVNPPSPVNTPETSNKTDSLQLVQAQKKYDSLFQVKKVSEEAYKINLGKLKSSLGERELELKRLQGLIDTRPPWQNMKDSVGILTKEIEGIKAKLADTERRYELLKAENEALRKERDRNRRTIDSLTKLLSSASLIGRIYYDREGNDLVKPANVPMYLIPKTGNRRTVKNVSVYEITCYEKELKEANGIRTVTDNNGNYAFRNVPAGEYLLKICTYYGGFYTVKIDDPKKQVRINFNASPPIRYPYTN